MPAVLGGVTEWTHGLVYAQITPNLGPDTAHLIQDYYGRCSDVVCFEQKDQDDEVQYVAFSFHGGDNMFFPPLYNTEVNSWTYYIQQGSGDSVMEYVNYYIFDTSMPFWSFANPGTVPTLCLRQPSGIAPLIDRFAVGWIEREFVPDPVNPGHLLAVYPVFLSSGTISPS